MNFIKWVTTLENRNICHSFNSYGLYQPTADIVRKIAPHQHKHIHEPWSCFEQIYDLVVMVKGSCEFSVKLIRNNIPPLLSECVDYECCAIAEVLKCKTTRWIRAGEIGFLIVNNSQWDFLP